VQRLNLINPQQDEIIEERFETKIESGMSQNYCEKTRHCLVALTLIFVLAYTAQLHATEIDKDITTGDGLDVNIRHYSAHGQYLMLWLAPEYGFRESHRILARAFSAKGIEIWQVNIAEALFLPQSTRTMRQLDGNLIADLVEAANSKTGKKILLVGDSYGASAALIGAHRWQERQIKERYLIGALLFSPYSLAYIPPLGKAPQFLPVVYATNIPIMIVQAKNSGIYGQFSLLLDSLRRHQSPVYVSLVPDVMSLFYVQPATAAMTKQVKPLANRVNAMIKLLENHKVPLQAVEIAKSATLSNGIDMNLKPFIGRSSPVPIRLTNIAGKRVIKEDFKGKVTLVNFWATWCPPCVEEIPMLNRLSKKMQGQAFELISINYAEDTAAINDFMNRVKVEFPVLLDHNGDFARLWNVISYPSTFVVGLDGKIVYGVNAAIDWDSPDVLEKLQALYR